MSTEPSTRRKKSTSDTPKRSPEDDHRRLCVYEVDDPNQRQEVSDEQIRLQKRVAELESVIRELKNKPHPKWTQQPGLKGPSEMNAMTDPPTIMVTRPLSTEPRSSTPSSSPTSAHWGTRRSPVPGSSPSSGSPSSCSPSPLNTPPSPLLLGVGDISQSQIPSVQDLTTLLSSCYSEQVSLDGLFDSLVTPDRATFAEPYHTHQHTPGGHCGCLNDVTSYNVVLELSLRLRRAAEILGHSPQHTNPSGCSIHQRIASLDRFASEALGNVNISSPLASGYPQPDLPMNTYLSPTSTLPPHTTASRSVRPSLGQSLSPHLQGMRPWDFKTSSSYPSPPDDALMSWEPSRLSPPEWMHPKSQ
ncbi:hypothetical protein NLI96_g9043 [Meripilus lineatus]|uniref:Uncharacterized protein n=1 Tax=Meripilus lineatus TaxID=2056292 RepID=A0AAD5UXW8_9APHY|nr:hypothetical protein NLI96_g9043 [Physisporinus lineatus]